MTEPDQAAGWPVEIIPSKPSCHGSVSRLLVLIVMRTCRLICKQTQGSLHATRYNMYGHYVHDCGHMYSSHIEQLPICIQLQEHPAQATKSNMHQS